MATTIIAEPDLRQTLPFNATADIGPTPPSQLKALIESHPELKIYTPASPSFNDLKKIWNLQFSGNSPLAIIRPTSSSEISSVLKFCSQNNLPVTIRSGGHDLWGRSNIASALVLDIREVNTISLSADRKSVTIGGGVQTGPLVDYLDERGLVTTCTLAGIVGHVGWAFSGGFGPFANSFGLGVDQILSAKVITASGEIAEAGEGSELLWGVKGAGGAFGVVSEVRLKVYELPKMLGGSIMFKFEEARQVVAGYLEMLEKEGRPGALTIGFHFSKRMGKPVFMAAFSWASTDFEKGRKWLAKVKGLGTEMMDMVTETTMKKWSDQMAPMLPPPSHNSSRAVFINGFTPDAVKILAAAAEKIPDGVQWGIGTFPVFGESTKPHPESSFRVREPFGFIHALGPVADPSRVAEGKEWTDGILNELKAAGLVKANYLGILGLDLDVEECFGKENFGRLKALKRKVDPENVFKHVPAAL